MYSSTGTALTSSKWSGVGDLAFSVLETPGNAVDDETVDKFRAEFAYDEKETLLGCGLIRYVVKISANIVVRFPGIHLSLTPRLW
jgi:hypothetical protein